MISQRSRSGRSTVTRRKPKDSLGRILTRSPSSNVAVELGDLGDVVVGEFLALLAEALAHLLPQLAGVDELDLAAAFGALAVGDDPEVGGDAGVVEELVGQRDDGFEPVVLDDPAADLRLPDPAAPVNSGEPLKTIASREPPCSAGFIFEIMCCRNRNEPSLMRGRPAPKRPAKPCSCSSRTAFSTFFHSTPNGGLASR